MKTELFDYKLPEDLIAQYPKDKRDHSKMLVYSKKEDSIKHCLFKDIYNELNKGDVLVLNNTKVQKARLFGNKETGGKIEVFIMDNILENIWEVMARPSKRIKIGTKVFFDNESFCEFIEKLDHGKWKIKIYGELDGNKIMEKYGNVPLPPYIKKEDNDVSRYQTVYADNSGAVAAPTAGLHFTEELLDKLKKKGVIICYITLHVGYGTFKPVDSKIITDHKMHKENYIITKENADIINRSLKDKRRIIAVGTTVIRTLESNLLENGKIKEGFFSTDIFIYPGFKFSVISAVLTNFHLPKSTLLMLVSAFMGRENALKCYKEAIKNKYRFYSFGDCMLIMK